MKLKKVLLVTLTLVMALGICLCGCKSNNQIDDDEPPTIDAYNDKIKSKVKDLGIGYWKTGDDNNYTIFTLERQNEYLFNENYLNGVMFFTSTDYDKTFYTTVTYNDETIWAFSDLSITFNVDGNKMTLNVGDKQYILDRVTINDVSTIRDPLIAEIEKNKELQDDTPSNGEIEITTSTIGQNVDTSSQNIENKTTNN